MRAVLHTYDKAYGIEGETYEEVTKRYGQALRTEDPVFEFKARTQAFTGPLPVLLPITSILRFEAE